MCPFTALKPEIKGAAWPHFALFPMSLQVSGEVGRLWGSLAPDVPPQSLLPQSHGFFRSVDKDTRPSSGELTSFDYIYKVLLNKVTSGLEREHSG